MNKSVVDEIRQLTWKRGRATPFDKELLESIKRNPFSRHSIEILRGYGYNSLTIGENIIVGKPSISGALENLKVMIRYYWIKRFGI